MAIRQILYDGTNFATPSDRVKPTDLNDTFGESAKWNIAGLTQNALGIIETLKDRTMTFSKGQNAMIGENFTSAGGRQSSVDTSNTTATFDTDKYKANGSSSSVFINIPSGSFKSTISSGFFACKVRDWEEGARIRAKVNSYTKIVGTLHDPDSFTNTSNAFDGDRDTFASKFETDGNTRALGRTFTSTGVGLVKYKVGTTGNSTKITIQTYNGSAWSDAHTISASTAGGTFEGGVSINSTVQGVRIAFDGLTINDLNFYVYELEIFESTINETSGYIEGTYDGDSILWPIEQFAAFTSESTQFEVELIQKTTSPTAGVPSISGCAFLLL